MDSLQWIQQFHLIRPYWLLAIFPLALTLWLAARTQVFSRSWASVIDKRLLPHLLQGASTQKKTKGIISLFLPPFILGAIVIMALAGPAFDKRPQAVFKTQSALVIVLDLSRSMDATDIKPSRLNRAHFKINDIIEQRKEGQTALIVYAADAYVVSPLTDDADTIASQISALETHIMPAQGSRLDIALQKAEQLFINAGHAQGDILVITDSISSRDTAVVKSLSNKNFITSILAVGTQEGAPISQQNGGFVKDRLGAIVVPKLDVRSLKKAAVSNGGRFSSLTPNDKDIKHLLATIELNQTNKGKEQTDASGNKFKTDIWHEEGPWLLLLVIPFAAYAFRKGLVFVLVLFILPLPQPAQAFGWSDLWSNSNQQAAKALVNGDAQQAAKLFNDPQWKATAQYKAGEYQQAADLLENIDTADANYNRGNALAKANDMDNAIKAYDRSLELNPDHEDAKYNKQLLEQAKKQQEQNKDSQEGDEQKDNKDKQQGDSKDGSEKTADQKDGQKGDQKGNEESNQQSQSDDSQQQDEQEKSAQQANKDDESKEVEEQQSTESKDESREQSEEERKAQQQKLSDETPDLEQQQTQQWLKKIPDDPGGLLRRKFKYQYAREKTQNEENPW